MLSNRRINHLRPAQQQIRSTPSRFSYWSCRLVVLASFLQCRDMSWQSKAAAEAALLLKEQQKLERETGQVLFVGLSSADTLATCFRLGHASAAARMRKTFAVPETRWYWLKLTALAAAHDWDGENAMLWSCQHSH
jgi:hypothetical protein